MEIEKTASLRELLWELEFQLEKHPKAHLKRFPNGRVAIIL